MSMKSSKIVSLLAGVQLLASSLLSAHTSERANTKPGSSMDPLPLRCVVNDRTVRSPQIAVTVAAPFRYVGGQRFLLRGVADAEQHLFVVPGASGEIEELLWLQFEEYLPKVPGTYDYEADGTALQNGLAFFTNVRRYTSAPQSGSDRERAFELLANTGYHVQKLSARVRLVYLPTKGRRSEVMIIYAVPSNQRAEPTTDEGQALIKQALQRISVRRR